MKRDDLQAIRGVAILLVLAFHLQPTRFPLGFVGVDMFFVLSGFLMALILSKESMACNTFQQFYVRRFKRIVPVYYICLFLVFIGCAFILLPPDKDQLLLDLKWALPFLSNIQPFYEIKGYWDQVTAYRFLVHCWSLGVEIQFYVIAPFIITITNRLHPALRYLTLLILISASLVFQLVTPEKISYDLLPSRIWQFVMGVLCFKTKRIRPEDAIEKEQLLENIEEEVVKEPRPIRETPSCSRTNVFSEVSLGLLIIAVAINPIEVLTEKITRIIGCFIICLIIRWPAPPALSVVSNRFLVYVGDLSYTMYLIHWPIIVAAKYYYNINSLRALETGGLFVVIFLVTMSIHYLIEKPLITFTTRSGLLICITTVVLTNILGAHYNECCLNMVEQQKGDINITAAIQFNTFESGKVYFPLPCDEDTVTPAWTNWTSESALRCQTYSNGTLKILVMGNSIAYRAFPLIKEVLKGRYKELRLFSRSSSPPLSDKHPEVTAAAHIVAAQMKPDFIWNIHCEYDDVFIRPFVNKTSDEAFLSFQKHLDFYMQHTKYMIIDLPYYWSDIRVCYEIIKRLQQGNSLDDLKISRKEAEKQQKFHQERLLALNCSKCIYNHVEDFLWDGDTYWFYNRQNYFGWTKEGQHFTPEFLEKRLKPLYERTVEDILRRLEVQKKKK